MARYALCIGINYGNALAGTLSDVDAFRRLLGDRFGYWVRTMRDDCPYMSGDYPARANIIEAVNSLVSAAQPGDHLVFYCKAFHKNRAVTETPGTEDEKDGKDEAILPRDFILGCPDTYILDDEIRAALVNPAVDRSAHIVIVFDCCHSGTAADLDDASYTWAPSGRTGAFKFRRGRPSSTERAVLDLRAVSWAVCQDPQRSCGREEDSGLFTGALVAALQAVDGGTSHRDVLQHVRQRMVDRMMDSLQGEVPPRVAKYVDGICQPQLEFLENYPLWDIPVVVTLGGDRTVDGFGAVDSRFGADPFCAGGPFNNSSSYNGGGPYNSGDPFNAGNSYNGNGPYNASGPFDAGDPYNGNDFYNTGNAFNNDSDSYNSENSFDNTNSLDNVNSFDSFAAPSGDGYADPGEQAFGGGFYGVEASWG